VEATGRGWPVGQTVMKSTKPVGTNVMLNEYACAIEGMVQLVLDWIGNVRDAPPTRAGGPNAPLKPELFRVSATRHGVMPTKTSAFGGLVALVTIVSGFVAAANRYSVSLGCQYSGAFQFCIGVISRWT